MSNPKGSGKGGRKKTPTREKEILGVRKDRINQNEPDRIAEKPIPEDSEALTEEGLEVFNKYATMLFNNGTLSKTDGPALFMLAITWQDWMKEYRLVKAKGRQMPIRNKDGVVIDIKEAPWSKTEMRLRTQVMKMLSEFGMTPVSRASAMKIGTGDDPIDIPQIT